MKIVRNAKAGTMESSDIFVMVLPEGEGLQIELESAVYLHYGKQIEELIRTVAAEAQVENGTIVARDFGALDCTIRARVTTALKRAGEEVTP